MSNQHDQPKVAICNANPKAPFSAMLSSTWKLGRYTDAAVAFITAGGVDFYVQHCLKYQDREKCRLCCTIQWPTDLDALARLSTLLGDNLRIHKGTETPVELESDITPMLHSKVIYTDQGDGHCVAFVGSHNWTANALNGVNFEASVRIICKTTDTIALNLREHFDNCFRRCVPFDPNDLAYYKAIQRELSSRRPPKPDAESVAAFEQIPGAPAVVIHAEGDQSQLGKEHAFLYLPIAERNIAKWFNTTTPTTILMFLYEQGTLFGHNPPASQPVLFSGPVGANNDVNVSPSRETVVTCQIRDLNRPLLQEVPDGNIPSVSNELYQVVAELRRSGSAELPIYHRGGQPMLEIGVRFTSFEEGQAMAGFHVEQSSVPIIGDYDDNSMQNGCFIFREPMPEKVIRLDVPERRLYSSDVEKIVQHRLSLGSLDDAIRIAFKENKKKPTYVYQASFELR